jgi:chromosome segregation ATPase
VKHGLILQKRSELASLISECDDLRNRLNVITDHLTSVRYEVTATEQLFQAKQAEIQTERDLSSVASREKGKIDGELKRAATEVTDIRSKDSQIQARILQSQGRIESLKEAARMNAAELERWIQAARDREEDFLMLQRYRHADDCGIRAMLLEIERATSVIQAKAVELEQEVTATRALQIELDATAEQFRKLHEERSRLLAQWEATLERMQGLNTQIARATTAFEERKADVLKASQVRRELKADLHRAEAGNRKAERDIIQRHKQIEVEGQSVAELAETVETQRQSLEKRRIGLQGRL